MPRSLFLTPLVLLATSVEPLQAQTVETVGSRALGMGGAFVAVADDSSATWWNPAGLAAGALVDLSIGTAGGDAGDALPARHTPAWWLSLGTPPLGVSYYRLRITDIALIDPTAQGEADREDQGAAVPTRSLTASQVGATFVQTVVSGVHAGTTLKYVRGDADGGPPTGTFDLDVGLLAVGDHLAGGVVVRNVRQPVVGGVRLDRQVRLGLALRQVAAGPAEVTVALDGDARAYDTVLGERQVVAVGGEAWVFDRRVGLRAGVRFNTTGAEERAWTAGGSLAVRSGVYVEGHLALGGNRAERGWGVAARASF
jgi:hypothetical protein